MLQERDAGAVRKGGSRPLAIAFTSQSWGNTPPPLDGREHGASFVLAQEQTNFDFGSPDYSREELVAELGSAFLCAQAQIDNSVIDNTTAYLQSWLKVLQEDQKLIIYASAKAQKAVDYLLGKKPGKDNPAESQA